MGSGSINKTDTKDMTSARSASAPDTQKAVLQYCNCNCKLKGQGADRQKTNPGTPVVGGWIRVRKSDGVGFIFSIFFCRCRVFELPSPRNAQKRDKKNREKIGFGFLVEFFVKTFRHDVFCNFFWCVFLNSRR
jgi:hypothetical protein